jgi:hypothetical protein
MAMHPPESPGRLCLILQRVPELAWEPDSVAEAPLVRIDAYARDWRVFGWVSLRTDRLTDLLNDADELLLVNVEVESLIDGRTISADEVLVRREELIAVQASGPRGVAARRRPTRTHPVAVQSGPYLIGGYLHTPPGVDPMADIRDRSTMIPLTNAWAEFWAGGHRRRQWVGTMIVNRDLADWIEVVAEEDLTFGQLAPRASGS